MKSVTKMQFEQLGAHPGGAPSRPREPDFFGRNWQGVEGLDPYRDLRSRDPDRHSIALEGVRRAIGTGGAERVEPTPAEEERALAVVGHEIAGREIERGMDTTAWRSV